MTFKVPCLAALALCAAALSPSAPSPVHAAPYAASAVSWSRVGVAATEWRLVLSRRSVRAGNLIVQLQNQGEDGHDLAIRKTTGSATRRIREQRPGQHADMTLRVSAGTYRLWCTLPGHKKLGMHATLKVSR